jgi:manganese/iron transport system substrate-binding protein
MTTTRRTAGTIAVALTLATVTLTACSSEPASQADGKLLVATTVAPLTSIASAVAGNKARVEGIVPEGTNSHTFEPSPQVAQLLSKADLVFINGLKLEEPTKDLAARNMKDGARLVEVGNEVLPESDYIYDFSFPEKDGKPNPHLWTDPTYAKKYATVIAGALGKADPQNAAYYKKNATTFNKEADALDAALRKDQVSVPRRVLLTYHDAYAYFAKTYGWKVIGAVQPKNFEDPAPKEIARIIDQVREEKLPTIFGSEVFPSSVLSEIGKATGARYEDSLRDDDLPGKPGETVHSWLGLMRYNYQTMIKGLGGKSPALDKLNTTPANPDEAVYPQ